ncbi:alternative oxidase [Variovorax sp. J22P240]|uniref:alternative oxidase n=1 Tax=Variovorax sp. J22P240 TaxID=3053514 RepID=UPI002574B2E1|nr:alternative oxidase [Variovorax sp. J22P240]MDM0001021.1 alternative oxidase [Variovorax sp. J22P240]
MNTQHSTPSDSYKHHKPHGISDRLALGITLTLRLLADTFFAKRYGNRAIVLETVAAVPGMVGGMLIHLKCLRWMIDDEGWIQKLLTEAENERMHLMTFLEIAKPNWFERIVVLLTQAVFCVCFLALYVCSARTAHRLVGYFEEEAVVSYTLYLKEIDEGRVENVVAPALAIAYWGLDQDARLRDVVLAVRDDEAGHRDVNHAMADSLCNPQGAHEVF